MDSVLICCPFLPFEYRLRGGEEGKGHLASRSCPKIGEGEKVKNPLKEGGGEEGRESAQEQCTIGESKLIVQTKFR